MESDDVKAMASVARVMALSVAITARIEGMKTANTDRERNGKAIAYDEKHFFEAEQELINLVSAEIGC